MYLKAALLESKTCGNGDVLPNFTYGLWEEVEAQSRAPGKVFIGQMDGAKGKGNFSQYIVSQCL